jgi:hypothetical protein
LDLKELRIASNPADQIVGLVAYGRLRLITHADSGSLRHFDIVYPIACHQDLVVTCPYLFTHALDGLSFFFCAQYFSF